MIFDGSSSIRSFSAETPDGLPNYFVVLPVICIRFISAIMPTLHFGFFPLMAEDVLTTRYREWKEDADLFLSNALWATFLA